VLGFPTDILVDENGDYSKSHPEGFKFLKGGLRALYRTLELPGQNPLKDAHAALDAAVLDAYGFWIK